MGRPICAPLHVSCVMEPEVVRRTSTFPARLTGACAAHCREWPTTREDVVRLLSVTAGTSLVVEQDLPCLRKHSPAGGPVNAWRRAGVRPLSLSARGSFTASVCGVMAGGAAGEFAGSSPPGGGAGAAATVTPRSSGMDVSPHRCPAPRPRPTHLLKLPNPSSLPTPKRWQLRRRRTHTGRAPMLSTCTLRHRAGTLTAALLQSCPSSTYTASSSIPPRSICSAIVGTLSCPGNTTTPRSASAWSRRRVRNPSDFFNPSRSSTMCPTSFADPIDCTGPGHPHASTQSAATVRAGTAGLNTSRRDHRGAVPSICPSTPGGRTSPNPVVTANFANDPPLTSSTVNTPDRSTCSPPNGRLASCPHRCRSSSTVPCRCAATTRTAPSWRPSSHTADRDNVRGAPGATPAPTTTGTTTAPAASTGAPVASPDGALPKTTHTPGLRSAITDPPGSSRTALIPHVLPGHTPHA